MSYDNILYDTDGRVATVTLNRPEKLNALSNELRGEMFHALKAAEADAGIAVVIIKGAGRASSAGYDLQPSPDPNHPHTNDWTGLPDTGTTHPQHYDWSRHAVMGNFIIWSWPSRSSVRSTATASPARPSWPRLRPADHRRRLPGRLSARPRHGHDGRHVGALASAPAKAREFAYLGDPHSGADMYRWGWANYALPAEDLDEFTMEFAQRMGHIDNHLLMYSKRSVNRAYEIQGYKTAMISGTDVEAMSKHRPEAGEWGERVQRDGLKSALEWRDGPFRDFRGARANAPHDRELMRGASARPSPAGTDLHSHPRRQDRRRWQCCGFSSSGPPY